MCPATLQPQPPESPFLLFEAGTQLLLVLQMLPEAQSSTLVHSVLQVPLEASHTYGAHSVAVWSSSVTEDSRSAEHLEPVGMQLESAQLKPSAQSSPFLHAVRHSVAPQL